MAVQNQIQNFVHLPGHNCVTTAIRNIINHYGFRYQEPMIYGLAEGLGFQFQLIKGNDNPYLSGAGKELLESFCKNLHLTFDIAEFDDDNAAMDDLQDHIRRQIPVIVQVDLFYLPYFSSEMHFAGHRIIPVGYDDQNIYCSDTGFRQIQSCPMEKFIEARRSSYPPFTPNRRRYRIDRIEEKPFVEEMVTKALYRLHQKFENHQPGYDLLQVFDLRDHLDQYKALKMLYTQIEKAGTGGSLGRKLFAQFLDQSGQVYARPIYEEASAIYSEAAEHWREIAVIAKRGSVVGIAPLLEKIYQLENEGIEVFSSFESADL